ncbi:uncharacterized protein LOC117103854, partial [Anneissia japonica]|uniref:uncharacterized protein LOC117103854 n=1 Tax=Anneissia japonica TaxID=1529436 RepID=UPI00142578C2
MELQPLSVVVNDTAYMLAETIRAYDQLQVDIMNIDQDQYRNDVNTLYARAENNLATALALEEIVFVKLGELEALKAESDQLYMDSVSADEDLDNYIALLALWNGTSYSYYSTAVGQSASISTVSFTDEQVDVAMDLELSQNTSVQAANFYAQSTSQGQRVNSLQASIRSTESTLLEVQTTVDATHEILDIVDVTLMRVDVVLNATQ